MGNPFMSYASYLSSFSKQLYNSYRIVAENLVKYMLCWHFIQIFTKFSFGRGYAADPAGELTTLPQTP